MALDLAHFRRMLLDRIEELSIEDQMSATDRAPVTLEQDSVGRLSRIDAMQMQAMALAQARRRQLRRTATDAALARIDSGEFEFCVKCGEDIAVARLEVDPAVTTCIQCAQQI